MNSFEWVRPCPEYKEGKDPDWRDEDECHSVGSYHEHHHGKTWTILQIATRRKEGAIVKVLTKFHARIREDITIDSGNGDDGNKRDYLIEYSFRGDKDDEGRTVRVPARMFRQSALW